MSSFEQGVLQRRYVSRMGLSSTLTHPDGLLQHGVAWLLIWLIPCFKGWSARDATSAEWTSAGIKAVRQYV